MSKQTTQSAQIENLSRALASTYTLQLKTQNYHWNVTGPMFPTLHALFEQHYNALAMAVDLIAERIRALGERAPGSYQEFAALSEIEDELGSPSAMEMVAQLADDHERLLGIVKQGLELAEAEGDAVSADLFTGRMTEHTQTAWMLRATIE